MIKSLIKYLVVVMATAASAYASEKVCHHCEEIRIYNAEHHHNYEYYEDFVKDASEGKAGDIALDATKESASSSKQGEKPVAERSRQ